jgi:hypothetical protein
MRACALRSPLELRESSSASAHTVGGQIWGHITMMLGKLHKVDSDPRLTNVRFHKDTKPSKLSGESRTIPRGA